MTAVQRIAQLRAEIERHNHAYYVLDAPTIPDAEYDKLFRELQALEAQHPELLTPDSPTQRVGGKVLEGFAPVRHAVPMLSIRTETDTEASGAFNFDTRVRNALGAHEGEIEYSCELKFDGLAINLRYERGVLVAGCHARRRRDRRGCDTERAHHPLHPVASQGLHCRSAGSARRGVHGPPRFRSLQRKAARTRAGQRWSTRATAPQAAFVNSIRHWRRSARCRFSPTAWARCRGGRCLHTHSGHSRCSWQQFGLPVCDERAVVQRRTGAGRISSAHRGQARRAAVRHRRRGVQGQQPRTAGRTRLRLARAALGRGAQIPGGRAAHRAARHRDPGRAHRQAHAGGQAGAGVRRRHHGQQCHAAQRRTKSAARTCISAIP